MEIVRKLDINDLEQIVSLRSATQNFHLKYMDSNGSILNEKTLIEKTKIYVRDHLDKNLFMFGLFIDDELVANCGFYLDEHFPTYDNASGYDGHICNVFTKEEYRGKGFQRKVFDKCFEYAKESGITSFKLSSRNEAAIALYKSFGFKQIDNMYSYNVKL